MTSNWSAISSIPARRTVCTVGSPLSIQEKAKELSIDTLLSLPRRSPGSLCHSNGSPTSQDEHSPADERYVFGSLLQTDAHSLSLCPSNLYSFRSRCDRRPTGCCSRMYPRRGEKRPNDLYDFAETHGDSIHSHLDQQERFHAIRQSLKPIRDGGIDLDKLINALSCCERRVATPRSETERKVGSILSLRTLIRSLSSGKSEGNLRSEDSSGRIF